MDDLIRGKKIGLKRAIVWGTLSVALAGVPFVGQSIGKYINPAKPAITASETQVGANVVKTSENSVASSLDKNELLRIMQTGEGNLYDLLKRAGVQPSFSSEDVLAAKNVVMQYKPKDIMTGKISTEGIGEIDRLIPGTPGIVNGGNSTVLGKNMLESMGVKRSTKWTGYQAQHIIPAQMADNVVIRKIGMDLDDASNGIFLRIPDESISPMSRLKGIILFTMK